MGPIELKLRICALVDIPITIVVFFVCQVARKTRSKKRPLSRWPMDAVSELQPAKRDRICIASCLGVLSLTSSLFWTVTGCDWSKGGSWSKCGSMIVATIIHSDLLLGRQPQIQPTPSAIGAAMGATIAPRTAPTIQATVRAPDVVRSGTGLEIDSVN